MDINTTNTVENFVNIFNNSSDKHKENLVKGIIKKKYAKFAEKEMFCTLNTEQARYDKNGIVYFDPVISYINTFATIMCIYVNLTFKASTGKVDENGDVIYRTLYDDYDSLKECGALDMIYAEIGKDELDEIYMLNKMIRQKYNQEQVNLMSQIGNQVSRFGEMITTTFAPIIEEIFKKFDEFDKNDFKKIINEIDKMSESKTSEEM